MKNQNYMLNSLIQMISSQNTEINFFTGMFDFSDDGKRSSSFGIQHQNEDLNRDTFLGNLSPVTGALITADNATYFSKPTTKTITNTTTTGFSSAFLGFSSWLQLSSLGL